jgi:nucleotide-binding universal stress UspA family protein
MRLLVLLTWTATGIETWAISKGIMFRHVLVPLDVRSLSKTALMTAVGIANEYGAKLTLIYVIDQVRDFFHAAFTVVTEDEVEQHEERVRAMLTDTSAIVEEYGGTCSTYVAHGSPTQKVIASMVCALDVDVIVTTANDRSVLRDTGVPVLVVHEAKYKRRSPLRLSKSDRGK